MRIDLDELEECGKCGIIFNRYLVCKRIDSGVGYSKSYKGNCPVCNNEILFIED